VTTVHFYFAIGSRYSYLAASQIAALEAETGCAVEWHPLNSVRLFAARGSSPFAGSPISGQYEWSYREQDAIRWAELYGIPFAEPRGRVEFDPGLLALASTAAKRLGQIESYSQSLFSAMFSGGVETIDEAECIRRGESCGLPLSDFKRELHSEATSRQLEATTASALESGVFGVPSFVAADALYWGNDRIVLLRHHLLRESGRPTGR
jgi:2-hydroxychromene-2-carboxylate isomerase